MGRGPKKTSLQRRHTDGQEAHKQMLNIADYQRHTNQKLQWEFGSEEPPSKSLQTINAGEGVEKREPSYTVGGNVN